MTLHENSPWWEPLNYMWLDRCDETMRLVNEENDLLDNLIYQNEQQPVTKDDKSIMCNTQKL
jgi:hypothetical protein